MARMLVGYAHCSTDAQDLTVQRDALTALGVKPNRIYVDRGLTGLNRARPGLRGALAACRSLNTLVVWKLDRLGRSVKGVLTLAVAFGDSWRCYVVNLRARMGIV